MESNWSLDYCLACDRQTNGTLYCSQVCRLAELETSSCSSSEAASPADAGSQAQPSRPFARKSAFQLQPAFDFSSFRMPSTSSTLTSSRAPGSAQPSYPASPFPGNANSSRFASPQRVLTPSTSRSSLSSVSSNRSSLSSNSMQTRCLSDQARTELRSYSNSFDLIRNWKRRMA